MQTFILREPQVIAALLVAGACFGGIALFGLLRRKKSPDEQEQQRRQMLVREGRIIDGTIIDVAELDASQSGRPQGLRLILYKYEIAGVSYECSQDVTLLGHLVDIHKCRVGFPASVRYAPNDPSNSLIIAETWSGLRETANSVPFHPRHLVGTAVHESHPAL